MIGILKLVGSKVGKVVMSVLAVGLILFGVIQFIQSDTRDRVIQEYHIEQLQDEVKIRREVNEVLRNTREANPDRSGAVALERLCQEYGRLCTQ